MIQVNVRDAKTHLSRYLARVEAGDVVVLCRRNVPFAELRPVRAERTEPRPLGVGREIYGEWNVPESFFDPLLDDVHDAFEGRG